MATGEKTQKCRKDSNLKYVHEVKLKPVPFLAGVIGSFLHFIIIICRGTAPRASRKTFF